MDGKKEIGRLALRVEGEQWVAYYALKQTSMEGAVRLGQISLVHVARQERKAQFMDLMREVVADMIEDTVGVRPTWGGPHPAPQHERSGRA